MIATAIYAVMRGKKLKEEDITSTEEVSM